MLKLRKRLNYLFKIIFYFLIWYGSKKNCDNNAILWWVHIPPIVFTVKFYLHKCISVLSLK